MWMPVTPGYESIRESLAGGSFTKHPRISPELSPYCSIFAEKFPGLSAVERRSPV